MCVCFLEHHRTRLVCENERLKLACKNETVLTIYSATFGHLLHGSPYCPQEPGSHVEMGVEQEPKHQLMLLSDKTASFETGNRFWLNAFSIGLIYRVFVAFCIEEDVSQVSRPCKLFSFSRYSNLWGPLFPRHQEAPAGLLHLWYVANKMLNAVLVDWWLEGKEKSDSFSLQFHGTSWKM